MKIERINLDNFRNIKKCSLDVSGKQVILKGENGQGKTNLLEAVYLLCYGSSFRTQNLKETIRYSAEYFYLKSEYSDNSGSLRTTEISYDGKEKRIKTDGNEIHDRKELIYSVPCISFSHEDMELVRGEPEYRRRFFDQTMTLYDSVFFDDLRRYKQVLRQRNAALKQNAISLLDVYDEKLAFLAVPLIKAREKVCTSFSSIFPDIYRAVSLEDRDIKIIYRPSWNTEMSEEDIIRKLREQRDTDLRMLTTTGGPHRDRFIISDENGNFVNGASTGQVRLVSLAMRSTQAAFFRQKTASDPLFLIDDVLLELDYKKRSRYLDFLGAYSQAFFTFLPEEKYFGQQCYAEKDETVIYFVRNGDFERQ